MKDEYGKEFWSAVILGAVLIIAFVKFLFPRPHRRIREARKQFIVAVNHTVACIAECKDHEELNFYRETPTNIFMDYFDVIGRDRAIHGYNKMTRAFINKDQQLNGNEQDN